MANQTYVSPVINTQPKRTAAYDALMVLIGHLKSQTGGYTMDIVSIDFGVTTPQVITLTLTAPLPAGQVARYNLT